MARGSLLLLVVFISLVTFWPAPGAAVKVPERRVRAAKEQLQVDSLLDNILLTVQRQMSKWGVDVETLSDVMVRNGQLTLIGTQGIIRGLTTIYRSDSAFMEYGNGSVSLTSSFSLQTLELSYIVNAKYLFLSVTHDVSASVRYNSVKVRAGIFYKGDECFVGLEDVSVDMLDGVTWRTSGFGAINTLVSATINLLVPPATIKDSLNSALKQAMSGFRAQCAQFIPGVDTGFKWQC